MQYKYWLEDGRHPAELDRDAFLRECEAFLKEGTINQQWTIWVATLDGEIVSHIFVHRVAKIHKPSKLRDAFGYVSNVYTRPAYRGRGIGERLMEHVKSWAQEQDFEFLLLWPSETSAGSYGRADFITMEAVEHKLRHYIN